MNFFACFASLRPALPFLLMGIFLAPMSLRGASAPVDQLISKLPDPDRWTQSPLEAALKDPDPMFKDPVFLKMAAAAKRGNLRATLESVRTLTATYPNKPELHFLRGLLAHMLRLYPEAEDSFRTVTHLRPKLALPWVGLAGVQRDEGHQDECCVSLRTAAALQPKYAVTWDLLAGAEARRSHFDDGIAAARHATALQPRSGWGWAALAYCEAAEKKYDAAIGDYRQAIAQVRNYTFANRQLGICYVNTNRLAQAIPPLKTAMDSSKGRDYLAATELGYCYLMTGHPADGAAACQQAVHANPKFDKGWDLLGVCYRHEGKPQVAVYAFKRAVEANPGNAQARKHLAEVTATAGHA